MHACPSSLLLIHERGDTCLSEIDGSTGLEFWNIYIFAMKLRINSEAKYSISLLWVPQKVILTYADYLFDM